jgi:tetratricopeptide (TPR) repeat protein
MIFKFKIYFFSLILWFASSAENISLAQKGDSLFQSGKYTEALQTYESVFEAGTASPSMLLKMAFIHEGLNQHPEALFFLEKYYQVTSNRKVLSKINDIATEQQLSGYENDDIRFLRLLINKNKHLIVWPLTGLLIFTLFYLYLNRNKKTSVLMISFQIMLCLLLWITVNKVESKPAAIVKIDKSILMSGPAASAEPVNLIDKGHKVEIVEAGELWTKIKWKNQEVFIRTNKLMII